MLVEKEDNCIDCQAYYCSNGGLLSSKDDYLLCFGDPQRIPRSLKKQLRFYHICPNLSTPFNIYSISKFSICSPSGLPALVATISLESLESQEKRGILKLGASNFQIRWRGL